MPPILDVAIGTIFVFLLFSLVVSVLNEVILSQFDQRAKFLHMGLQELFGEAKVVANLKWRKNLLSWLSGGLASRIQTGVFTKQLYQHGLINALSRTDKPDGCSPSYIPAGAFVTALLDIISDPPVVVVDSESARKGNRLQCAWEVLLNGVESQRNRLSEHEGQLKKIIANTAESLEAAIEALPSEVKDHVNLLKVKLDDPASNQNKTALLAVVRDLQKNVPSAQAGDDQTKENIETWIAKLRDFPDLQESLHALFTGVDKDVGKFKTALEGWFNASMDRVSGWYKRFAQNWMIVIGFVLAVSLNVDTVHIVEVLSKSPNLAKAVASQAASYLQDNQRPQTDEGAAKDDVSKAQTNLGIAKETLRKAKADLATAQLGADKTKLDEAQKDAEKGLTKAQNDLDAAKEAADPEGKFHAAIAKLSDTGIPMGWDGAQLKALDLEPKDLTPDQILNIPKWATWFSGHITVITSLILGWFLTALAASLGAPFWFDTLSRIMNIRNSGKHPGEMDPTSTPVKPPSATLDQTPRGG